MDQKLKIRTKTAIVFGATVLALVLSGNVTAMIFVALVAILAGTEFANINKLQDIRWHSYFIVAALMALVFYAFKTQYSPGAYIILLALCCLFNLFLLVTIYLNNQNLTWHSRYLFFYMIIPAVLFLFYLINNPIESFSMNILLIILLLIWSNDSFAYLIGSKIGKYKLFERVSPNKTWEGFIGGAIGTLLVAIILAKFSNFDLKTMILLALICSIFGTYGDLYQSSVKREFGLKDSGNILPGHGGFWDRFDSFIYVWPFVLMVLYLNSITQIN